MPDDAIESVAAHSSRLQPCNQVFLIPDMDHPIPYYSSLPLSFPFSLSLLLSLSLSPQLSLSLFLSDFKI